MRGDVFDGCGFLQSAVSGREAEAKTRQAGARFDLVALPETVPEAANPLDFKPEEMLGLYEAGRDTGLQRFGSRQAAR